MTVVEDFESFTGDLPDTLSWVKNGSPATSQVTSNVTEGFNAFRMTKSLTAFNNISVIAYVGSEVFDGILSVDVEVVDIPTNSFAEMTVYDELANEQIGASQSTVSTTGSYTLSINTEVITSVNTEAWTIDAEVQGDTTPDRAGMRSANNDFTGYEGLMLFIVDFAAGVDDEINWFFEATDGTELVDVSGQSSSGAAMLTFDDEGDMDESDVTITVGMSADIANSRTSSTLKVAEIRAYPSMSDTSVYDVVETFGGTPFGGGDLTWVNYTADGGVVNGITGGSFTPEYSIQIGSGITSGSGLATFDWDNLRSDPAADGAAFSQGIIIS
jgi:hypothetical protein